MNNIKHILIFSCILAGIAWANPVAFAGMFDVSFGLDIYGTRDDNILLMNDEQKNNSSIDPIDEILQIRPQIKINYMGTRSSIRLKYELFREWYNRYHPLDRTPTSYTDGSIVLAYELTERLTIGFFDNYIDSLYSATRVEIPDVRDDYTQNIIKPSLKYTDIGDRFDVTLSGLWSYLDYEENPMVVSAYDYGFADWDQYGGSVDVSIDLKTRTKFLANAGIWEREYDLEEVADTADHTAILIGAGISQDLGEGITLKVLGSYFRREYNQDIENGGETYDALGGLISFTNQFSGITRLELEAFSNLDQSERISSAFYRNTGVKGVFYTRISERIESSFLCSFSKLTYDNIDNDREDDYFQAGVKVGYMVAEWLSIRGQYMYSQRDSNDDFGDYDNNLISIYLQFRHNALY
ncbi:outer membrane beta-barrel protein [bacterium]|nr:outer membrane beta-barrel protein [candidate division CSSED10-310 bacterium]